MAYTGNIPAEQYISTVKDTFNGNNSTTDFTLSRPSLANNLEVFVENVQQEPTTAYTVSGTTISFTSAPPTGTGNIYVIHRGQAVQTVVPPAGISVNATDLTVTGASALQDGLTVDNDGATVATFDRATSDGTIVDLQKDGTTVGSIGNRSAVLFIEGAGSNQVGLEMAGDILPRFNQALDSSGNVDIGASAYRFRDVYLSGGVYLGGTGSANHLDDYEEGTYTPAFSSSGASFSYSVQLGRYIKIGTLCHCIFNITLSGAPTGTTSNTVFVNTPFNTKQYDVSLYASSGFIGHFKDINLSSGTGIVGQIPSTESAVIELKEVGDNIAGENSIVASEIGSTCFIRGSLTFHTAS